MAMQSLYRRYRPRRFSEVKGQDHVVRALRNAVAEGREGQAYLFSGPRGTGKTTSARILAKVLNCANPVDGEPCCECESCLAVERGISYDVHELDAASNNGVDAMRDLIEKASLGTPGRHKVYILDEVHMLSKPAEAALLKTLEEPPNHVVFVLATTDPQKMSDTIRSRTQHLQFHLLPADTLQDHVRWVAADAGLEVSEQAIGQVIARGGGSARDTLSALELVANSGGDGAETIPLGEFVEAMIEHDPGRGLTMIGQAVSLGRDPRTLTEELIAHLRNGFLSLMAPELVQLPGSDVDVVAEQARRLGPPGLVRAIEVLGESLAEMRHAPDPRVLLDVAVVQLTSPSAATDVAALADRVHRLEQQLADGTAAPPTAARPAARSAAAPPDPSGPEAAPAPRDPSTGRAALGGRAKRAAAAAGTAPDAATAGTSSDAAAAPDAVGTSDSVGTSAASGTEPPDTVEADAASDVSSDVPPRAGGGSDPDEAAATSPRTTGSPTPAGGTDQAESAPAESAAASAESTAAITAESWEEMVKPGLKGMARAVFAPATFVSGTTTAVVLSLPNDVHRAKCEQNRTAVESALAAIAGGPLTVELVVGDGAASPTGGGASDTPTAPSVQPVADQSTAADDDIDIDDLVDAPPETVKTPIDRLAEAFPGSELVEERD